MMQMTGRPRSRTTLNLDRELVREAQEILGTTEATETIHLALWEVISRYRREMALAFDFSNLPLDEIREKPSGPIDDEVSE